MTNELKIPIIIHVHTEVKWYTETQPFLRTGDKLIGESQKSCLLKSIKYSLPSHKNLCGHLGDVNKLEAIIVSEAIFSSKW